MQALTDNPVIRWMMVAAGVLLAGSAQAQGAGGAACPGYGAKPAGCVEPPLASGIYMWGAGNSFTLVPADPDTVRPPVVLRDSEVPPSEMLPALLAEQDDNYADFVLELSIGGDDAIVDCRPISIRQWRRGEKSRAGDPALLPLACPVAQRHGRFRHAIDAQGRPVMRTVMVRLRFDRLRHGPMPTVAALARRAWLADAEGKWPPTRELYRGIIDDTPDFGAHLIDRTALPDRAVTGLLLDVAVDGRATCTIAQASGDARLDRASCDALAAQTYAPRPYAIEDYPVRVQWRNGAARLELPIWAAMPSVLLPESIPAEQPMPAGDPKARTALVVIGINDQNGVAGCMVMRSTMDDAWDAASCALARGAKVVSGRDVFGDPAWGGMRLLVDWKSRTIREDGF